MKFWQTDRPTNWLTVQQTEMWGYREVKLRLEHESVTSSPFRKLWRINQPADQMTDKTESNGNYTSYTLPIIVKVFIRVSSRGKKVWTKTILITNCLHFIFEVGTKSIFEAYYLNNLIKIVFHQEKFSAVMWQKQNASGPVREPLKLSFFRSIV